MNDKFDVSEYAKSKSYTILKTCGVRGSQRGGILKIPPLNNSICAPGSQGSGEICYNKTQLVDIIKAYNQTHGDKISTSGSKSELWKKISEKMTTKCDGGTDTQICLLEQNFVRQSGLRDGIKNEAFKPVSPLTQWAWLTTTDIATVLKQYEQKYPDFLFLGTVPMDFCSITPNGGVCGINIRNVWNNGKRKIGAVFNTDPSSKPGQHWISMYIDLNTKEINYYDSFGKVPIPNEIGKLIDIIRSQSNSIPGGEFTVKINTCRHQQNNSECGVYSINFIVERLAGKTWEEIMSDQLLDSQINQRRKLYFRSNIL